MKKYNYIIVSLLACLLTTSCNDYFDQVPDDRLSLKEIFTTRDGALRYLSNVYTFLPDEFNQRQVHETSLYRTPGPWTGASDEAEWTNDKKEKLINNNSIDATEGTMVLYRWKSWFSGIHEAAVFTENVDQAPLTVTERNQWKAEARALRAIYYFYLVRTYGPVPLLEKDFPMDTPSDELQLPRNTVDECFDFIVSELKGAQNDGLLDDASTDKVSGYGRIDKAIAQAFIIEALTYRASWLFNGEFAINFHYFSNGFKNLIHRSPNMDSLIALGAAASFIYSVYGTYRMAYFMGRGDLGSAHEYMMNLYYESCGMILDRKSVV